jgi:hypothetical protein
MDEIAERKAHRQEPASPSGKRRSPWRMRQSQITPLPVLHESPVRHLGKH